jgi:hypothetical protein
MPRQRSTTIRVILGGGVLLSRSSARKVLARVNHFDKVLLDFSEVTSIGPAFADEIFRIFAQEHPKWN